MYRTSFPQTSHGALRRGAAATPTARLWAAWALRRAGTLLSLASRHLLAPARQAAATPPAWPQVEFHADAGAPEGALYVNGEFVGTIGVSRL